MTATLILVLILLASELNTWMAATAMLMALADAGLIGATGVVVWVRLGFEE